MALGILIVVGILMIPVAIGWRIGLDLMEGDPTPRVKAFFWVMSALFIALAVAVFVATRFLG